MGCAEGRRLDHQPVNPLFANLLELVFGILFRNDLAVMRPPRELYSALSRERDRVRDEVRAYTTDHGAKLGKDGHAFKVRVRGMIKISGLPRGPIVNGAQKSKGQCGRRYPGG